MQKCFHRALRGLRAARLNQRIVVTGGYDDRNDRDEVILCGSLKMPMWHLARLQVLEYNVEAKTWTEIGNLERGKSFHAIAEIGCVGNLNPVKEGNKIIIIIITKDLLCPDCNW